ncbi:hypothetical protein [Ensifer canadensis]
MELRIRFSCRNRSYLLSSPRGSTAKTLAQIDRIKMTLRWSCQVETKPQASSRRMQTKATPTVTRLPVARP